MTNLPKEYFNTFVREGTEKGVVSSGWKNLHKVIELDGKKKTRKVDVLLRGGNEENIIKYAEKVDR